MNNAFTHTQDITSFAGINLSKDVANYLNRRFVNLKQLTPLSSFTKLRFNKIKSNKNQIGIYYQGYIWIKFSGKEYFVRASNKDPVELYEELETKMLSHLKQWRENRFSFQDNDQSIDKAA